MFIEGVIVKEGNWWWIEQWVSSNWYRAVAELRQCERGKLVYGGGVVDNIKDRGKHKVCPPFTKSDNISS